MTTPALERLLAITSIPTAAGREWRVADAIRRWCAERPALRLEADPAGNLVVAPATPPAGSAPPLFITAHLDHPAFVVERVVAPSVLELQFRGGVMDVFFEPGNPVAVFTPDGRRWRALLTGAARAGRPGFPTHLAELDADPGDDPGIRPGDVATWDLPSASIADGLLHAPACDDLSAVAAAMAAMDALLLRHQARLPADVRLLFTRAEEIGFIGAIAAVRHGTIPRGARVLALENSRAFPDAPIHAGPIVRVGDRLSVFTPALTAACAARAEELFGGPSTPTASQTAAAGAPRPWQRKLMPGGACEASVYCHAGFEATCLCLPLGNYHNMPHLAELQAGTYDRARLGPPRCAPEQIGTDDYLALVDLLVALAEKLPAGADMGPRIDKLFSERSWVLEG